MKLNKSLLAVFFFAVALLSVPAFSQAAETGKPVTLRIQTLPLGTTWYIFGATYAKLLQDVLPEGSLVDVLAKGGGVANVIAVDRNQVELALANLITVVWGWNGDQAVYNGVTYQNVRSLGGGLNSAWLTGIVRKDFLQKSGQSTIEEIFTSGKPVRVVLRAMGSTNTTLGLKVIEALGSSPEKIKKDGGDIFHVGSDQTASMMRDGMADISFEGAIFNHPAITEIALTTDVEFLPMPQKFLNAQVAEGIPLSEMPANMFKGQTASTTTVDFGTVLIVNKDMDEDLAYLLTKTLMEQHGIIGESASAWADMKPENCWKPENNGIPLHPGAIRYYKERGWMQ